MTEAARTRLARVVLCAVGGFVVLITAAMAAYPGGTWLDRERSGYTFWQNYWCDLLRDPALDGESNWRGARLAQSAMLVLAIGLVPFWLVVSSHFNQRRLLRWWIRILGTSGSIGLFCVTLLPSDRFGVLHSIAVVLAGPMGIVATLLAVIGLARTPGTSRLVLRLGGAVALISALCLLQYARQVWFGAAESVALPALQKLATVLLLLWICGVTWITCKS